MTISGFVGIVIGIIFLVLFIVACVRRNQTYKLFNLGFIIFTITLLFASVYIYVIADESRYDIELYYQIVLDEDDELSLSLIDSNNQVLLSNDGETPVQYIGEREKTIIISDYNVVYFKEYDNLYVVIYSSKLGSFVEYDRLMMPNYNDVNFKKNDLFLYVIDKSNANMILIQDYDLIGYTIDLTSFNLSTNQLLSFTILQPYQDKIWFIMAIFLDDLEEELKYTSYYYQEMIVSMGHFYSSDDSSWITFYAVSNHYSVWADSNGEVHGEYFYYNSNNSYNSGSINDDVFLNSYISEGYIIMYQGEIYYIGETRNHESPLGYTGYSIYRLNRYVPEEVQRLTYSDSLEDLSTVDHWLDILYSLDE